MQMHSLPAELPPQYKISLKEKGLCSYTKGLCWVQGSKAGSLSGLLPAFHQSGTIPSCAGCCSLCASLSLEPFVHPIRHDPLLQKGEAEFRSVDLTARKMSAERALGRWQRMCPESHLSHGFPEYASSLVLFLYSAFPHFSQMVKNLPAVQKTQVQSLGKG